MVFEVFISVRLTKSTIFLFLLINVLANYSTHFGTVAENSSFWVFKGELWLIYFNILYTSSWKPCLSISSASSKQILCNYAKSIFPLCNKSRSLPGVAEIISAPRLIASLCCPKGLPPYTFTQWNSFGVSFKLYIYCLTWIASYLVGRTIRNLGFALDLFSSCWSLSLYNMGRE